MKVRLADVGDIPGCVRLFHKYAQEIDLRNGLHSYSKRKSANLFKTSIDMDLCVVMEQDGEIVGASLGTFHAVFWCDLNQVTIHMYVQPEYRNKFSSGKMFLLIDEVCQEFSESREDCEGVATSLMEGSVTVDLSKLGYKQAQINYINQKNREK